MRWRNVKLIFHREVRDQLRDRRTLFMIAILPLLLYPGLGIGMLQMTVLFEEQARTVVILGADELPKSPQLLKGDRIAPGWFTLPGEAETLLVVTDRAKQSAESDTRQPLLQHAEKVRELSQKRDELEGLLARNGDSKGRAERMRLERELDDVNRQLSEAFAAGGFEVLIAFPQGFAQRVARETKLIERSAANAKPSTDEQKTIVVYNNADKKSQLAYKRVKEALQNWEQAILRDRLRAAHLPETFTTPVNPQPIDLANKSEMSNSVWSMLFPALLVIMTVTGAFYPAVDLAAGEKERGTMETLLICPATRTEIVLGKFFTVMLFSLSTALLNMLSMGLTGKYMVSLGGGALSKVGDLALPSFLALVWVGVLLVPLAALFSALCLALATFARSSKEGQYYLTPLLMVTMGLTVFCLSPAVEITPFYSIMPVMGPALLLKELIASPGSAEPLLYAIPVLVTSFIYSMLALWWAIEQFSREDVLFREAERFDLGLWLRHLMRDKEATPSFSEAGLCFVVIMLVQFYAMKVLQTAVLDAHNSARLLQLQMTYLVATVGGPALLMGVILTRSFRQTFRLHWPKPTILAAAIVLPCALHPLTSELMQRLNWFFPKLPSEAVKVLRSIQDNNLPTWFVVLAFAVTPAICEELAFRGFILSGFSRSRRMWLAIALSSLAFGIVHQIPQQVFNATLLGLVLGLLVARSNSLFPAMVFHFIYNSLEVLRSRVDVSQVVGSPIEWFVSIEQADGETIVNYAWPTLLICAVVAALILRWLVKGPRKESQPLAKAQFSKSDRLPLTDANSSRRSASAEIVSNRQTD